ncbi:hypothetical protein EJB05_45128, partial [Eragrostis curvula]
MLPAADDCPFSECLCRSLCSPRIRRVDACLPADAVDSPAWSVLVCITSMSDGDRSLLLHRFRVAHSGLGPEGLSLSLCLFSSEFDCSNIYKVCPPVPLTLHMNLAADASKSRGVALSCLPELPSKVGLLPTCPISAAGELWAPYLTGVHGPSKFVMQRLEKDAGRWVEVAAIDVPLRPQSRDMSTDSIPLIQGYAVVGDTILLSLYPYHLFFTFDCTTSSWAPVVTNEADNYIPIRYRGVYVKEDDTIYCLLGGVVYAYKLCVVKGEYRMAVPTFVDRARVCPMCKQGQGFLAHLSGRVMCSVWIGAKLRCNCDSKHVLITTFRVKGDDSGHLVHKGIEVLHCTSRLLDKLPSKYIPPTCYFEFSFLQYFLDGKH